MPTLTGTGRVEVNFNAYRNATSPLKTFSVSNATVDNPIVLVVIALKRQGCEKFRYSSSPDVGNITITAFDTFTVNQIRPNIDPYPYTYDMEITYQDGTVKVPMYGIWTMEDFN